jgi:uncharacterized membrane protein
MDILKEILVCFFAGMGAGLGTGFAGMSAAAVITPMLVTFLGMEPYAAVGIALASDVLASAVSAYTYKKNGNLDIKNGLLTFAFSCITIFGLGTAIYVYAEMADGTIKWQIFTIAISFITLNILLYVLIRQISRLQKSKYELKLLEEKMELEKARYNEAGEIWENVRKVRHDMKQHLTVIQGQIEGGDMQGCKSYLENLLPTVERMGKIVRSDNKILDYIINAKLGSLHDTEIVVSGTIGDLSDINELDLACLFGNILDNAVEAIRDTYDKRLELIFFRQNSNRIIICKNTVKSPVLSGNRELTTTKASPDMHGYGTKIVKRIVSDYRGMVDYFEEFGMFGVQIVLPDAEGTKKDPAAKT